MSYQRFGVMLDCSRNAVMKPSEIKKFIDVIASLGYNCLQLYMEDTYEVKEQPYFGFMRGKYTKEEMQDVDAYAREKGVELMPCMQTLAHFSCFCKNFAMRELFDVGEILLVEDEKVYAFLDDCFRALSEMFSSRLINIGMDEAHLLGAGRYLKQHGYVPKLEILTKHLQRVTKIAEKYGFEVQMWSDMFFRPINNGEYYGKDLHIPEHIRKIIPKNVALAYWDYTTVDEELYDSMFQSHLETEREIWFMGGAWTWMGFAPLNKHALLALKPAMQAVRKHGIQNVVVTLWGNDGNECSVYSALPTLYATRMYADGVFDEDEIKRGFEKITGIPFDDFMAVDLPNDFDIYRKNVTGYPENPSKWALYQDCFQGLFDADLKARGPISYGKHAEKLYGLIPKFGEYGYVIRVLADLCAVLDKKACLGLRTRDAYAKGDKVAIERLISDYEETVSRIQVLEKSFYELWHKENKSFGWEVQDARLGGLERRIKTCAQMLREYVDGKRERIEELEEPLLSTTEEDLVDNCYANILSRGVV